jgi:hypothetical protein
MHSWAYKNFKPRATTTITLNCTREENHCIMGLNSCCKEHFLQLPFVCSLDMLKFEINQISNNNTLSLWLYTRRIFWAAWIYSTHEKQKQSVWIAQEKKTVAQIETLTIKSCFLHLPLSAIVYHCLHFLFAQVKKILHCIFELIESGLNPWATTTIAVNCSREENCCMD